MKRIALFCVSIFVLTNLLYSQDIINETGKEGKFIVRDNDEKEAMVIDEGDVSITGALKVEELEEGSKGDKVVVWDTEDKKFKALYNMIPSLSVMAADSWTEDGSGNIYRATGMVGIGTTTPERILDINPSASGSAQLMRESDSDLFAINLKSLSNRGELLLYKDGAPTVKLTGFGNTYMTGGNVGIGTTSPGTRLHVVGTRGQGSPTYKAGTMFAAQQNNNGHWAHIAVTSANNGAAGINFGDVDDDEVGYVRYWNVDDDLEFGTNGTEKMRITADGYVGIGTLSPGTGLHIRGSAYPNSFLSLESSITGNDAGIRLWDNGTTKWHIFNEAEIPNDRLEIRNNTYDECLIIDQTTGYTGIGTYADNYQLQVEDTHAGYISLFNNHDTDGGDGIRIILDNTNTSTSNRFIEFQEGGYITVGYISGDGGGGINWTDLSDERLKTNVKDMNGAIDMISQMKVKKYEMISHPGKEKIGLIAQELQQVYPVAVSGNPNGDVNEEPMGIAYNKLVPILIQAINEQQSTIQELKQRMEYLESN